MAWFLLLVCAYLIGSIPTGVLVAQTLSREDPRSSGSGNIGATNVGRVLGKKAGVITLLGDVAKGFIPTIWAAAAFDSPWAVVTVGMAAYVGHLFPLYLKFQGGKGVATGLGVFLALTPTSVVCAAVVFAGVVWKGRMVSLGSLCAAGSLPLLVALFGAPVAVIALAVVVAVLTGWKHRANWARILAGTENRLGGES
jgi:glycerol-3-phosphate acyltransferase PlsY